MYNDDKGMHNTNDGGPTREATARCAYWLAECLCLGWSRDDLDFLEALWWKHHDRHGNLTSARTQPEAPSPRAVQDAHIATWGEGK